VLSLIPAKPVGGQSGSKKGRKGRAVSLRNKDEIIDDLKRNRNCIKT